MPYQIDWNELVRDFSEPKKPAKKTVEAKVPPPARRPDRLRLASRKPPGRAVSKLEK